MGKQSFCPDYPDIKKLFSYFDYSLGGIFLIYFLIYSIPTIKELCVEPQMIPGGTISQISFMLALLIKGIGIIISGLGIQKDWDFVLFSLFSNGLPGYFIAMAYCFIFFSWCSVCVQAANRTSKNFFQTSYCILKALIILIWIGFIAAACCVAALYQRNEKSSRIAHMIEAGIASTRDLIIAFAFTIYLFKIREIFGTLHCSFRHSETRIMSVCIILTIAVFYRSISIEVYTY